MDFEEGIFEQRFCEIYNNLFFTHFKATHIAKVVSIAGFNVKILFATEKIYNKVFPAIAHTELVNDAVIDMQLCVFDLISAKVSTGLEEFTKDMYYKASAGANVKTMKPLNSHYQLLYDNAYYYDQSKRLAFWFAQDISLLNEWHFANPFRHFFYDWLLRNDRVMVHAAAVADADNAVILVGQSGSGKSTLMMSCYTQGLTVLGDDHCVLDTSSSSSSVYSLYNAIKIDTTIVDKFAGASSYITGHLTNFAGIKKSLINLHKMDPDKLSLSKSVKAIIKLAINPALESPQLNVMSSVDAIKYTALSTIAQLRSVNPKMVLGHITQAITSADSFYLELSRDFRKNYQVIKDVLAR